MKGQSEIVSFVLLFLVGLTLFMSAVFWSRGIFDQNIDSSRINVLESFMDRLDSTILSVVENGGKATLNYGLEEQISLIDIGYDDVVEIRGTNTADLPSYWVDLKDYTSKSQIREKMEGNIFTIQLLYNKNDYIIDLYSEGVVFMNPEKIIIEKDSYFFDESEGKTVIRIKMQFK